MKILETSIPGTVIYTRTNDGRKNNWTIWKLNFGFCTGWWNQVCQKEESYSTFKTGIQLNIKTTDYQGKEAIGEIRKGKLKGEVCWRLLETTIMLGLKVYLSPGNVPWIRRLLNVLRRRIKTRSSSIIGKKGSEEEMCNNKSDTAWFKNYSEEIFWASCKYEHNPKVLYIKRTQPFGAVENKEDFISLP